MMKKIIFSGMLCVILMFTLCTSVFASTPYLTDEADILSASEEAELSKNLSQLSERYNCAVYILTTESGQLDGDGYWAEYYYKNNDLGIGNEKDGCILAVDMNSRKWEFFADGFGSYAVNEDGFNYLADHFEPLLSEGDYSGAFTVFAEDCDTLFEMAKDGKPYTTPFNVFTSLIIALAVGFVIAFIVTAVMKGKLKSVRYQAGARDYMVGGSLKVTEKKDIFLYRHVSAIPKPQPQNNGGRSVSVSGGTTRGGGSF